MQYLFENWIARLTLPKISNEFWLDQVNDSSDIVRRLKNEQALKAGIDSMLDDLDIREGEYRVNGVHIFGSVVAVMDKPHYYRKPDDVDFFVWLNKMETGLPAKIHDRLSTLARDNFQRSTHCVVAAHHPFDHYKNTGELRMLGLDPIYNLYLHPDIIKD